MTKMNKKTGKGKGQDVKHNAGASTLPRAIAEIANCTGKHDDGSKVLSAKESIAVNSFVATAIDGLGVRQLMKDRYGLCVRAFCADKSHTRKMHKAMQLAMLASKNWTSAASCAAELSRTKREFFGASKAVKRTPPLIISRGKDTFSAGLAEAIKELCKLHGAETVKQIVATAINTAMAKAK